MGTMVAVAKAKLLCVENVMFWLQSLIVACVKAYVNTVEQDVVVIVSKTVEQEVVFDPGVLQTS